MRECYARDRVKGFLHAQGQILVNGDGQQVILRGWGMGNWDNPEGFMIGSSHGFDLSAGHTPMPRMDRGRALEQIVRETCGSQYLSTFWDRWHRAWLGEADIKLLADRGYNSVRLPIRACSFLMEEPGTVWNENAFAMLDDVLDWCEKHRVYAIIDLHAATAAQSCLPCDDGVDNEPHLYIDEEAMDRMYILMEEFARRYANREIVGGYDCINEPLSMTPRMAELTPVLADFYEEMVRRMRQFDKNHLILLNGTQFSSLMDVFDRDFDPQCHNWGIAIHAYSMVSPEVVSIAPALEKCRQWNVPLWMGETGSEKEYAWQTTMYEILAGYGAGYNLWSFKLCEGSPAAGVMRFTPPEDWQLIVRYAADGGPKPSFAHAQDIFDRFLESVRFENCREDASYHPYLLREGDFEIPAIGYNHQPADSRKALRQLPSPANYRQADGFYITYEQGYYPPPAMPGHGAEAHIREHMLLRMNAGEFASFRVAEPGAYTVGAVYAAENPAKVRVSAGGQTLFEGQLPAAGQTKSEEAHPHFPHEPSPNRMGMAQLGEAQGEALVKIEVLEGTVDWSVLQIRKK